MLNDIATCLKEEFKDGSYMYREDIGSDGLNVSFREWGTWISPEGEEDYDWDELSEESYLRFKIIIKNLEERFPDYSFDYDINEKNWIDVYVKSTQKELK